jgi:hypothetical protein
VETGAETVEESTRNQVTIESLIRYLYRRTLKNLLGVNLKTPGKEQIKESKNKHKNNNTLKRLKKILYQINKL